jgi:hypothetical protein
MTRLPNPSPRRFGAKALIGALALIGGLAAVAPVAAAEATLSLNVRSGPGTSYRVVDTLYAGENVTIDRCSTTGWCYIIHSGPDGWVSRRYLLGEGGRAEVRVRPQVSFSFSFGRGDGFSYGLPRGGTRDLVCLVTFYNRNQVEGGADANVQRAEVMSRAQAEYYDSPNDRQRIFDYGTNQQTRETCAYLDSLNN